LETDCEQIHYCAICDGAAYRDKDILIVGGGNSGVEEAFYLLNLGVRHILLIEELDHLLASKKACQQLMACPNVEIMTSTYIESLQVDRRLETVTLHNKKDNATIQKAVDGIFVYIGQTPQTDFFCGQIDVDEFGYIPVDVNMKTGIAGVFAAGDVIQKRYRQITTAMGDATIAALSAIEYLTWVKECRI
jgi:thioredoxin reductase (NADPH)